MFKKLLNLFKFSALIVPMIPGRETETIKMSLGKIIFYLFVYTVFIILSAAVVVTVTPLKKFLYVYESEETKMLRYEIGELNKKVLILTKEIDKIARINKNLKMALMLADSSLFLTDSISNSQVLLDTLETKKGVNKTKLNVIYYALKDILMPDRLKNNLVQDENLFFILPAKGYISREYNPQIGHFGIDIALKRNTPIYAAATGYVVYAGYSIEDGNILIISHSKNYITIYKHCGTLLKKQRENVIQGEPIALSGNTGANTTGPHLHFELWINGKPINPLEYILQN